MLWKKRVNQIDALKKKRVNQAGFANFNFNPTKATAAAAAFAFAAFKSLQCNWKKYKNSKIKTENKIKESSKQMQQMQ